MSIPTQSQYHEFEARAIVMPLERFCREPAPALSVDRKPSVDFSTAPSRYSMRLLFRSTVTIAKQSSPSRRDYFGQLSGCSGEVTFVTLTRATPSCVIPRSWAARCERSRLRPRT